MLKLLISGKQKFPANANDGFELFPRSDVRRAYINVSLHEEGRMDRREGGTDGRMGGREGSRSGR